MPRGDSIGYLIKRISDALAARANCAARSHDLTFSQTRVLKTMLKKGGGELTQKQLESEFGVSHATLAGIVRRLAEKGFVATSVDERDRRQRLVALTDKGRGIIDEVHEGIMRSELELAGDMTDAELKQLRALLGRVYDNINKEGV